MAKPSLFISEEEMSPEERERFSLLSFLQEIRQIGYKSTYEKAPAALLRITKLCEKAIYEQESFEVERRMTADAHATYGDKVKT